MLDGRPSAYQESFAASGAQHIPGCYVFMLGLYDRHDAPDIDCATTEKGARSMSLPFSPTSTACSRGRVSVGR